MMMGRVDCGLFQREIHVAVSILTGSRGRPPLSEPNPFR